MTMRTNTLAAAGACGVLLLIVLALGAPWLAPQDPDRVEPRDRFAPPLASGYVLGTDELGRDVLSRIIYGSRVSLAIAGLAVALAVLAGGMAGTLAAYAGGWMDPLIMRAMDVLFAIPTILIALSAVGVFGRSGLSLVLGLGIAFTPRFARVCYSSTLALKEARFVEAARALGASPFAILRRDILPNLAPALTVQATVHFSQAMLAEAGLGFLGLGIAPPTASWGAMLSLSRQYMYHSVTLVIFPGLAIMGAVLAFNLLGDGLRDQFDPRAWQEGR